MRYKISCLFFCYYLISYRYHPMLVDHVTDTLEIDCYTIILDPLKSKMRKLFLFSLIMVVVNGARQQDEVRHLPGLNVPLKFKQYSGFLSTGTPRHLHYWFVESMRSPSTDPMVVWLNGGPGCSSMLGLLTENGPFRINAAGNEVMLNPDTWNREANVLYLESPAGVGFSYDTDGNYSSNDMQAARDNYQALKTFFQDFPEFLKNDFFVTGESYGGVYVPTLSVLVARDPQFNFKGFAVGNGITNYNINTDSTMYLTYYHGFIDTATWNEMLRLCCPHISTANNRCEFHKMAVEQHPKCYNYVMNTMELVWSAGINPYNVYQTCAGGVPGSSKKMAYRTFQDYLQRHGKVRRNLLLQLMGGVKPDVGVEPPCSNDSNVRVWINSAAVRKAIHIPNMDTLRWDACSNIDYTNELWDMTEQYKEILSRGHRILVYNGDADMACNYLGDRWFVESLNLKMLSNYGPWYYRAEDGSKQIGGFGRSYRNLDVLTVKGAGHMVPTDQPLSSYHMINNYLKNIRV